MNDTQSYEASLRALAELAPRGWRMGLDRMQRFVELAGLTGALGTPPGPQYIQVAGTNGKGTTTAFLQSLMVEHGHRTGAGFSPYVYDPRERVQVNREFIDKQDWARRTFELLEQGMQLEGTEYGGPTEFEVKIALGLKSWLEEKCDWVALEVGLGGRLDATSVVNPACGIIVSIGLDHMALLGETEEKIAAEKAGILKPGMPLVLGEMKEGPYEVIHSIARESGSEVWELGREIVLTSSGSTWTVETPMGRFEGLTPTMFGAKVPHNMALAVAAMVRAGAGAEPDAMQRGVAGAWLPGRFEKRWVGRVPVILDGAHNGPSAEVLAESLHAQGIHQVTLVTSMLQGHETGAFYQHLRPFVNRIHVAPIDFFRARPVDELAAEIAEVMARAGRGPLLVTAYNDLGTALARALDLGSPVLITGSFYLLGDAGKWFEEHSPLAPQTV